jgi:hypothetical protein
VSQLKEHCLLLLCVAAAASAVSLVVFAVHRLVSNLDYKVTDEDIKELFGTVGAIKESYIHYDKK